MSCLLRWLTLRWNVLSGINVTAKYINSILICLSISTIFLLFIGSCCILSRCDHALDNVALTLHWFLNSFVTLGGRALLFWWFNKDWFLRIILRVVVRAVDRQSRNLGSNPSAAKSVFFPQKDFKFFKNNIYISKILMHAFERHPTLLNFTQL